MIERAPKFETSEPQEGGYQERLKKKADEFRGELVGLQNFEDENGELHGVGDYYTSKINREYHKVDTENEFRSTLAYLTTAAERAIEMLSDEGVRIGYTRRAEIIAREVLGRLEELKEKAASGEGGADDALDVVNDYLATRIEEYKDEIEKRIEATAEELAQENGTTEGEEKASLETTVQEQIKQADDMYKDRMRNGADKYQQMNYLVERADAIHNRALVGDGPLVNLWKEDVRPRSMEEIDALYKLPSERG